MTAHKRFCANCRKPGGRIVSRIWFPPLRLGQSRPGPEWSVCCFNPVGCGCLATAGLDDELTALEASDPEVARAAQSLDRVTADILARADRVNPEPTSAQLRHAEQEMDVVRGSLTELAALYESATAETARVQQERDKATRLLEYALHLRQHGERAPGGDETWAEFDRRAETLLRGLPIRPTPHLDAVKRERDEVRACWSAAEQDLTAVRVERDEALAAQSRIGDRMTEDIVRLTAYRRDRDLLRAELASATAELEQRRVAFRDLVAQAGWIVARDGGRYCERCEQEVARGQAYELQPGAGGLLVHIHCPDRTEGAPTP